MGAGHRSIEGVRGGSLRINIGGMHRHIMSRVVFVWVFGWASAGLGAEGAERLDRERLRSGVFAGASVVTGLSQLRTGTANVDMVIDQLPAVVVGLDLWASESVGVGVGLEGGTGADVTFPDGSVVGYNLHRFEAGGRYRWFFGARSGSPSVAVGLGVRGRYETVDQQRPSVLIERVVAGPELGVGFDWPLVADRLWVRVGGRAGVPFFVREPDQDSGEVEQGWMFGGGAVVAVRVVGGWYAQLVVDVQDETIDFTGPGSRAAGVVDARTHDRYVVGGLQVRLAL